MEIRLFGPLQVLTATGTSVQLGAPKQRAVLAMLALEPGRVVSLDRLIHELWAGEAPSSATGTLQAYVSHLRKALEPDRGPRKPPTVLLTREPGYQLALPPGQIDLSRFAVRAADGHRALGHREFETAIVALDEALALWRGDPLVEFADQDFAAPTIAALTELRATAEEDRFEARLATSAAEVSVADLERLTERYPYRERLHGLLALALYRAGRQAESLAALRTARRNLDELGLTPGAELQRLEHAILNQDATLAPPPLVSGTGASRRPYHSRAEDDRLIGREAALDRIGARLTDLRGGRGGTLLVTGEAGIGKTRLARAAVADATAQGITTTWGRCVDTATAPPFWPWVQALREVGAEQLLSGTGQELFELHQRVLAALADAGPVLVVLDDMHWADSASLRLLRFLAGELERRPVLLVVTVRPEPGHHPEQVRDSFGALVGELGTERLPVGPFTSDEVADYLLRHRGSTELAEPLFERSGGNPFYLGELARLVDSEGLSGAVPQGVRDVLGRRLSRLPDGTRSLLETASVAGREVSPELLEAVNDVPIEDVLSLLEPAVATGLLVESGDDYRFAHALVQDALHAELNRTASARLHLRIGQYLETRPTTGAAVLAHHFGRAVRVGGRAKAVTFAERAARAAGAQYAYDEAVRFWELALSCLGPEQGPRRCALLVELGRALRTVGSADRANRELERAIELAEQLDDRAALLAAAGVIGGQSVWVWRPYGVVDTHMVGVLERLLAGPLDDRDRAALLGTLGVELIYGPRRPDGEKLAAEAVVLARTVGDPVLLATTLNNYYLAAWAPGRESERLAAATEMLTLPGLPRVTELIARVLRMPCLLGAGELAEWDRDLTRCDRLLAEIGRPELEPMVRLAEVGRRTLVADWPAAETLGARFAPVRYGSSQWGAEFPRLVTRFGLAHGQGRLASMLDELVTAADDPDLVPLRPIAVLAALECGRPMTARELVARWGTEVRDDWTAGFLLAVWGLIAIELDEVDPAPLYAAMLPLADQLVVCGMGMVGWGSYHVVLAGLAGRMGQPETAVEHARLAVALHRRLGLDHWARHSERLLDTLTPRPE